jgi:hypothetical protein
MWSSSAAKFLLYAGGCILSRLEALKTSNETVTLILATLED